MTLDLDPKEIEFIINLLAQVPTGSTLQAGMSSLLPSIVQQTQQSQGEPQP